jgi:hypothetical protein
MLLLLMLHGNRSDVAAWTIESLQEVASAAAARAAAGSNDMT